MLSSLSLSVFNPMKADIQKKILSKKKNLPLLLCVVGSCCFKENETVAQTILPQKGLAWLFPL